MRSLLQVLSAVVMLGVLVGWAPAPVSAADTSTCDGAMPSCRPKSTWLCFHEGMEEPLAD